MAAQPTRIVSTAIEFSGLAATSSPGWWPPEFLAGGHQISGVVYEQVRPVRRLVDARDAPLRRSDAAGGADVRAARLYSPPISARESRRPSDLDLWPLTAKNPPRRAAWRLA